MNFIKKKIIKTIRFVVFALMCLRIVVLKLKYLGTRWFKKPKHQIGDSPKLMVQIFSWDLSENALKIRLLLVIIGFVLFFITLSVRLIIVATNDIIESNKFLNREDMFRRDIVDRHGNLLAVNLPAASLFAKPKKVVDAEAIAENLHIVFPDLDKTKILESLKSHKKFVWIKRDITPKQQEDIYNLGMPGLEFEREQKRIYTYGNMLSHVVGYVGRDMEGLAGVEKYFDNMLTSKNDDNPSSNNNLQLSIDVRIQSILADEIEKTVEKFKAKGGAGIIIDPSNGEILAMVSKPDFNPHNPGSASADDLFNMVTQGAYEMGSGMKSLTLAIGLDTSIISMHDAYDLSYMKVGKFKLKDTHPVKGWHSVPQIFLHSSNIGVSQVMLEIGKSNLRNYLKKLKLLEKLELEVPERARPLFPAYSRWDDLSLVTMSYGYAISESPAHFVQALMPLVNGGILYPLTLVKRPDNAPVVGERVFKEETSRFMRQMMRLVVDKGTGRKAEVKGYYVGGKTGTAEKLVAGKYDKKKNLSSFFGIMPASNPKYVIYVIFNEPKGIKETFGFSGGGWVGAPTAGAILERIAVLQGMNKLEEDDPEILDLNDIEYIINGEV
jgi:cell division protein FtsI (penicillin-binding protein 3)